MLTESLFLVRMLYPELLNISFGFDLLDFRLRFAKRVI